MAQPFRAVVLSFLMGLAFTANSADFKHEVEYLEPGKSAGMKYHLLYWDGTQWSMLGRVWRVLKQ